MEGKFAVDRVSFNNIRHGKANFDDPVKTNLTTVRRGSLGTYGTKRGILIKSFVQLELSGSERNYRIGHISNICPIIKRTLIYIIGTKMCFFIYK